MPSADEIIRRGSVVLSETDDVSVGVTRVLSSSAGTPGEERKYEVGDEALVEAGLAEWVVAPVHEPAAGRRLDHDAEREPTPRGGVVGYPPAEPTTGARRLEARETGSVEAHRHDGLAEQLAAKRFELARDDLGDEGDTKEQAALGGLGARSGPVTKPSDLTADKQLAEAAKGDAGDAKSRTPGGAKAGQ
jgi:hypothetical protein